MSVPAVFLPEADDDVAEARAYYEQRQAGIGDEFVRELQDTVARIGDNPQKYAEFRQHIRAAPLRRFPYVVYYRDRGTDILIIAVQHGRRSYRAWRGRA